MQRKETYYIQITKVYIKFLNKSNNKTSSIPKKTTKTTPTTISKAISNHRIIVVVK